MEKLMNNVLKYENSSGDDAPITVLQIRNSIAYGGVETTMLGWLDNIDKRRFNCPVAVFNNRQGVEQAFTLPLKRHGHEILEIPWFPGRNLRGAVRRLVEIIRERDVRLIHSHDWRSDFVGLIAAKKTGVPIMTTIYVWFRRPFLTCIKEKIDAWVIRHFDLVTAVCNATREQTIQMGVNSDKTDVLISGINPEIVPRNVDRKAIRARFGIKDDDIAFIFTARFYMEKAHDTLVKAFARALASYPNMKLLLPGTGPLEEDIHVLAESLGISEAVIMPGFVEDIPAILKSMDVMVHASLAEGIALAIYEGMISGLPVIGSDVDGTPEVVIPGKTGWLVPPGAVDELQKAIEDAAENPDKRQRYGRAARKLIMAEYNMEKAVKKLEDTYLKLAAPSRKA